MRTNIYGPRPKDAGFRCLVCGTLGYPLFGVALACPPRRSGKGTGQPGERRAIYRQRRETWEAESNAHTVCSACVEKVRLEGLSPCPTIEARLALEALSSDFCRLFVSPVEEDAEMEAAR